MPTQIQMSDEEYKARSVELAERAYRLKDRAETFDTSNILEQVGDVLIQVDQPDRFYKAQSFLEALPNWTDDVRSLAHEINQMDQTVYGAPSMTFDQSFTALSTLAEQYADSHNEAVNGFGQNLRALLTAIARPNDEAAFALSINTLLDAIEDLLINLHKSSGNETADKVRSLRLIRDSILVKRQLAVDTEKLVALNDQDISQTQRVRASEEALEEVYEKFNIVSPSAP